MRIVGVPEKDAGLLGRFAYWFSERRFGKVPEPVKVTAHHRKVLLGTGAMEFALDRSDLVDARLKKLAKMNVALGERFVVAERDAEVLAAVRYRTEPKRLLLGLLVADPRAGERRLAVDLYAGARRLALELGASDVVASIDRCHATYPYEAGYHRWAGGWRMDLSRPVQRREGLPPGSWRRWIALVNAFVAALLLPKKYSGKSRT